MKRLNRADTVRQPAIKERFVGGAFFGEAKIAFALQRFERAQQYRLAAALSACLQIGVEGGDAGRAEAPIRNQIGIILAVAVERGQRALEEGRGDRGAMLAPVSNNSAAMRGARAATWSNRGRSQ